MAWNLIRIYILIDLETIPLLLWVCEKECAAGADLQIDASHGRRNVNLALDY